MSGEAPGSIGAGALRELLRRHEVHPLKEFGQNFVIDPNTIDKMVRLAEVDPGDDVLEIGAGAGSLTVALASAGARVIAVELDRRLIPVLGETVGPVSNVEIVEGDALQMDLGSLRATTVVANLPYNIATPFVLRALETAPAIRTLTVMTQREVGDRLAAAPGTKTYGHVSVMVRYLADARIVGRVSRRAFFPVPGVDSTIVRIVRKQVDRGDHSHLFDVVRGAFSQRRKTIRNSLADLAGGPAVVEQACRRAGLDPGARAEVIDLEGFIALARELRR